MANPVTRLVQWLRAGYPEGVPGEDYVALFGILHRDLTEDEVTEIAVALHRSVREPSDQLPLEDIRAAIRQVAHERPSEKDIERVATRLAAFGWPLNSPAGVAASPAPAGAMTGVEQIPDLPQEERATG